MIDDTISRDEIRAARELRQQLSDQKSSDFRREQVELRKVREEAKAVREVQPQVVPNAWTEAELVVLRRVYPAFGARRVATLLGRTFNAVTDKASRIGIANRRGKRPDGTARTDRMLQALKAAGAQGLNIHELSHVCGFTTSHTVVTTVSRMVASRVMFAGGKRQNRRYFLTSEQADFWDQVARPRTQREIRAALAAGGAPVEAPMKLHPDFKFTRAPTPPAALRTNTYSAY